MVQLCYYDYDNIILYVVQAVIDATVISHRPLLVSNTDLNVGDPRAPMAQRSRNKRSTVLLITVIERELDVCSRMPSLSCK